MLVMNWMSTRLVTITPDSSMSQAAKLMKEYHIRHLPVMEDGNLVGIVSDGDLKRAGASDATTLGVHELSYLLSRVKVGDIMTGKPYTVHIYDTVEEAALLMLEYRVSGLPVKDDDGRIVAMVTQSDVFRALISVTGVTRGGIQFALDLPDEPGSIKEATDVIRGYGGRMSSILTSYDRVAPGRRRVYIRMKEIDRGKLMELSDKLAQTGQLLYVLDSRENGKRLLTLGRMSNPA